MLELDERGGEEEWRRTAGEVEATACCCLESMIFIGHSDGSVTVRWEDEVADSGEKGHLWSTLLVESRKDGGDGDNDDGDGGVARMYATRPMHVSRERSPVVLTVMASSGLIDLYRVSTPLSSSGVPPSAVLLRRLSVASDNGGTSQSPTGVVDTAYDTRTRTLFAATSSSLFAIREIDRDTNGDWDNAIEMWRLCGADGDVEEFVQIHVSDTSFDESGGHLLVSTTARAMVAPMVKVTASVRREDDGRAPCEHFEQIGTKPRRGRYGSCFHSEVSVLISDGDQGTGDSPPSDCWGFCARPGRRLWIFNGTKVEATVRLPPSVSKDITPLLFPVRDHLILVAESAKSGMTIAALCITDTERIAVLPEQHRDAMRSRVRDRALDLQRRIAIADDHVTLVTADGKVLRWTCAKQFESEEGRMPTATTEDEKEASGDPRGQTPSGTIATVETPLAEDQGVRLAKVEVDAPPRSPADSVSKRDSIFNTAGDWEEAVVKLDDSLKKTAQIKGGKVAGGSTRRKRAPVTIHLDSTVSEVKTSMRKSASLDAMSSLHHDGSIVFPGAPIPVNAPDMETSSSQNSNALQCWQAYAQPDAETFVSEAVRVLERDAESAAASEGRLADHCAEPYQAALAAYQATGIHSGVLDVGLVSKMLLPLLRWQFAYVQTDRRRRSTSTMLSSLNLEDGVSRAEDERLLWTASFELQLSVDAFFNGTGEGDVEPSTLLQWDDQRAMEFLRDHWNHLDIDRVHEVSKAMAWSNTEAAATAFSFSVEAPVALPDEPPSVGESSEAGGSPSIAEDIPEATRADAADAIVYPIEDRVPLNDALCEDDATAPHASTHAAAVDGERISVGGNESLLTYAQRRVGEVGPRGAIDDILSSTLKDTTDVKTAAEAFLLAAGGDRDAIGGIDSRPLDIQCLPREILEMVDGSVSADKNLARDTLAVDRGRCPWGVLVPVDRTNCACCGLPLSLAGVQTKIVVSRTGQAFHYGCMNF